MWIDSLTIALVQKDTQKIGKLINETPKLTDPKEIETAILLLKQASELLKKLKDELAVSMAKTKQNLDYLKSTKESGSTKLDIRS